MTFKSCNIPSVKALLNSLCLFLAEKGKGLVNKM